jgi:hypothetical protein
MRTVLPVGALPRTLTSFEFEGDSGVRLSSTGGSGMLGSASKRGASMTSPLSIGSGAASTTTTVSVLHLPSAAHSKPGGQSRSRAQTIAPSLICGSKHPVPANT